MIIAVGSDHAGYEDPPPHVKPAFMQHLANLGHEVLDCGTDGPASVDYPDIAKAVSEAVLQGRAQTGILVCGTGIGMSITANRFPGIRAAVCATPEMVRLARSHNDANILCLGKRVLTIKQCEEFITLWLNTPFDGGERHARRVRKMG